MDMEGLKTVGEGVSAEGASAPGGRAYALAAALITAAVFIAYANTSGASFHFDDFHQIVNNNHIRSLGEVPSFFVDGSTATYREGKKGYRPVTLASFAVNYALSGYRVWSYHLLNVALHCLNAWLLFLLLLRLSGRGKEAFYLALPVSLVFALHPVQTAAVTYVSGRAVLLGAFFGLGSFYGFIRYRESGSRIWAAVAPALFLLGLLSKEFVVCTVGLMAAYDMLLSERPFRTRIYLPFAGALALYLCARYLVLGFVAHPEQALSTGAYLVSEAAVLLMYVRLLLLPFNQNPDYYLSPVSLADPRFWVSACLLALAAYLLVRYRRGRPLAVFFGVWFLVALMPESSLVPIPDLAEEYRLYLPSAGFFAAAALACRAALHPPGRVRLAAFVAVVLAALTVSRNTVWATPYSLWSDAARKAPGSARAHFNLGNALMDEKRFAEAERELSAVLAVAPGYPERFGVHNNLGLCYASTGMMDEAERQYRAAISDNPMFVEPYYNLGKLYTLRGRYDEALAFLKTAEALNPGYSFSHVQTGLLYEKLGRGREALDEMREAVRCAPGDFLTNFNLALMYGRMGLYREAKGQAGRALEIASDRGQREAAASFLRGLGK